MPPPCEAQLPGVLPMEDRDSSLDYSEGADKVRDAVSSVHGIAPMADHDPPWQAPKGLPAMPEFTDDSGRLIPPPPAPPSKRDNRTRSAPPAVRNVAGTVDHYWDITWGATVKWIHHE